MKQANGNVLYRGSRPVAASAYARALLGQAIEAHRAGKLGVAEGLYQEVLKLQPDQPDALHYSGVLCHQRGDSDAGVALIERALQVLPEHADAHGNLGNIHKECGRLSAAEACYRKALACAPKHAVTWGNLGIVLESMDRVAHALDAYENLLKLMPDSARAHHLLGQYLRRHPRNVKDVVRASACFARAFALDPTLLGALREQGVVLSALGRDQEARDVYRQWLAADPDNPLAQHMLAACGGRSAPERAGDAYVRAEFDHFAGNFDRQLVENLHYRAPQVLVDALRTVLPRPDKALDVLDAGCGTGLCAPLLRPYARQLAGVDLSPGMLGKARQRGGYDVLVEAELTAWLEQHENAYDLVVSADTLVYFGDLTRVLKAMHATLRAGGWVGFSLEAAEGDGYELSPSGRYRHSRAYVQAASHEAGFAGVRIVPESLRHEAGRPVPGWVVLAHRGSRE